MELGEHGNGEDLGGAGGRQKFDKNILYVTKF